MGRLIARLYCLLTGWRLAGRVPDDPKIVIIGWPHTTNHDFLKVIAAKWAWKIEIGFLGKASLFSGPFGWLFRRLGGIPVDRSRASRVVSDVVRRFEVSDTLRLVLAPEGTRSPLPYWRSGFYHIALAANVPVVFGFIDYRTKRFGLGEVIRLSGDLESDMAQIREFYSEIEGKYPDRQGPIRLREEER